MVRLLDRLEPKLTPDIVIIEGRRRVHYIAANTVTSLDTDVLLVTNKLQSTWTDYEFLFGHWRSHDVARLSCGRIIQVGQ